MSKLADPTICPDCRAALLPDGTCSGCGLRLGGPLGVDLWQTMLRADALVERLRLQPVAEPGPVPAGAAAPGSPAPVRLRRLPSASVPLVLLALGGLCLLVAAVVFVAVAWSSLGVGARTAILVAVTAALALAAATVTRGALRWAAETLWLVVGGMVALDLLGARSAGLLGLDRLGERDTTTLLGVLELALGAGVAAWSATRATGRLLGPQLVAGLGVLLAAAAGAWTAGRPAAATAVAVPLLAALALLLHRWARWTALVVALVAILSWLVLVGHGLTRWQEAVADAAWWTHLAGWPLLVAAGMAALVAGLAALDPQLATAGASAGRVLRSIAAGASLACTGVVVVGPWDSPTRDLLLASVTVLGLGVLGRVPAPVWARPAALLSVVGSGVLSLWLLARPWASLTLLPADGSAAAGSGVPTAAAGGAPWVPVPVAVALLAAGWAAAGVLPTLERRRVLDGLAAVAPAVAGLAVATAVLASGVPLGVAVLAFAVALAAAGAALAWQQGRPEVELAAVVAFSAVAAPALRLALGNDLLTALTATALALALLAAQRLLRPALLWGAGPPLLAVLGVLCGALAAAAWGRTAGATTTAEAFTLAGCAAALGLAARHLARDVVSCAAMELAALAVGLSAVALAPSTADAALVATVVGTAVCLLAVRDGDRPVVGSPLVGWLGAGLLALATLLRVLADVGAPELVSLPGAALLLGAGAWRLRRDPATSTLAALGSGLSLALGPSLLLALDEPVSVRGALVGAAGLAALAVGVAGRWAAPFLAGALTTAALAVRHLGPVAEALPRWVSLGAVGLALLVAGITWEARRRNLAAAAHYLAALR